MDGQVCYHNGIIPVYIPPGTTPGLPEYCLCRLKRALKCVIRVAEESYAKKCAPAKTVVSRGRS